MAIVDGFTILKLSDDGTKSLAHGQIQTNPATTARAVDAAGNVSGPTYTEGTHFARAGSTVQRLAAYPASRQLLKFSYSYDDTPTPVANPYQGPAGTFATDRDALIAAYNGAGGVVPVNTQIQGLTALTLGGALTALQNLSRSQQQFDEKLLAVLVDIRDHLAVLRDRG